MSFEEFVTAHGQGLVRFAFLVTGDLATAEDLVQSALLTCYPRWDRIEQPLAYVRRAVLNGFLDGRRRRLREVVVDHDDLRGLDRGSEPPTPVRVDVGDPLVADVLRLPRRERAVLVLRYFEDMADDDIADLLGIAPPTVRATASRALSKLRHLQPTEDRP